MKEEHKENRPTYCVGGRPGTSERHKQKEQDGGGKATKKQVDTMFVDTRMRKQRNGNYRLTLYICFCAVFMSHQRM